MTTRPTAERTLSCRRAKELEGTDNLVVPFLDLRQTVALFARLSRHAVDEIDTLPGSHPDASASLPSPVFNRRFWNAGP
jgi:hypothetical protein